MLNIGYTVSPEQVVQCLKNLDQSLRCFIQHLLPIVVTPSSAAVP